MRFGVVGTGSIVEAFLQAGRLIEGLEFVAVYSRKKETGTKFATKNKIKTVVTDYLDLCKDESIDAIYIASPNSLHYEHAKQALNHNKHVIVEKPFTGNAEKAQELISLAQKKNLILFEAICNIHMPHMRTIKNYLDSLGKIKMIQCNYSQYSSRYDALRRGDVLNVFDPKMSGGALADINIYNLHFTMWLFGVPNKVHYFANTYENGIDTSGCLVLDYEDFKASLVGAKDSFSYNIGQIQGEEGYLSIPNGVNQMDSVLYVTKTDRKEIIQQDKPRLYYQIDVFVSLIKNQDFALRDTFLNHSYHVVKVAQEARKQIGLEYEY